MISPIAIIGGSGMYAMEALSDPHWVAVNSPFGQPSDEFLLGQLGEVPLIFLPRHGRGHKIPPSMINYRANIDALKRLGVRDIISVSAVGSLREDCPPGTFVIVDQFIDRTVARQSSFFETGLVAHVSMAQPVCSRLGEHLHAGATALGLPVRHGGTSLVVEGPQFSTLAESRLYQQWGCDVIGMTNLPEAKLAREAEICYATVAMVTDYDCWHPGHDSVTVETILAVLRTNSEQARTLVRTVVPGIATDAKAPGCSCRHALDHAVITAPEVRDPDMISRLDAVAGRVL
ncbi:MAG: S-methyl-5'-thioadenosine phosphorylase [Betaproteobacteria bacterium]|nr:S-methyl-5'-thioadenosine phosphorylase [Betaproteobacteria bacterium]